MPLRHAGDRVSVFSRPWARDVVSVTTGCIYLPRCLWCPLLEAGWTPQPFWRGGAKNKTNKQNPTAGTWTLTTGLAGRTSNHSVSQVIWGAYFTSFHCLDSCLDILWGCDRKPDEHTESPTRVRDERASLPSHNGRTQLYVSCSTKKCFGCFFVVQMKNRKLAVHFQSYHIWTNCYSSIAVTVLLCLCSCISTISKSKERCYKSYFPFYKHIYLP